MVYSCTCSTFILYVSVNSDIGFCLILGSFLTFWGPNGLFLGSGFGSKTVLGSTHVVEQLSFSMFPSILTFDFELISGVFFTFWSPSGLFLRSFFNFFLGPNELFLVRFKNCFGA